MTPRGHVGLQQLPGLGIGHFDRFALGVLLIAIEAAAVLLAKPLVLIHQVGRLREVHGEAIRIAGRHHIRGVDSDIDADDIQQVGGAHGPTPGLHHSIELLKIGAVPHQQIEAGKIGKKDAVDQKAIAVIDHHGFLAHAYDMGNTPGNTDIGGLLASHHFHQGHGVDRVEKMQPTEVLRPL